MRERRCERNCQPSDRVLRSHTRAKFDEGRAADVKMTTDNYNAIGSVTKPDYHAIFHRAVQNLNSVQPPLPLEGLSFDLSSTTAVI